MPDAERAPVALGEGLLATLEGFVGELRLAGIPVSLTENLDAIEALRHVGIEDRERFKYSLAATMVKDASHWKAFETVFEVYFSQRGRRYRLGPDGAEPALRDGLEDVIDRPETSPLGEHLSAEELAESLYRAMIEGNEMLVRAVARAAVSRYAGMEPGRPVGGTYYLYRVLRELDLEQVLGRLLDEWRDGLDAATELEERLMREEYKGRLDALRREIEAEIRRRLVADRGAASVAKAVRKPLPEDVEFMHASRDELTALKRAIDPLARKLAVRLAAKRRHHRKGQLNFRATMRRSLSFGGVPADPRFRIKRPSKPQIMVVADISGSVAAFARFTLHLVYATSSQFARVRSFVFIDGIDEVTDYFRQTDELDEAIRRINTEADVIWADGHSDYGHALEEFWARWSREVTGLTTVLVLGDARNNYHAAQSWVLGEISKKARHVFWLNPEPRSYWDTGDSIMGQYATHCEGVFEVRNLKQLERFVDHLV